MNLQDADGAPCLYMRSRDQMSLREDIVEDDGSQCSNKITRILRLPNVLRLFCLHKSSSSGSHLCHGRIDDGDPDP